MSKVYVSPTSPPDTCIAPSFSKMAIALEQVLDGVFLKGRACVRESLGHWERIGLVYIQCVVLYSMSENS